MSIEFHKDFSIKLRRKALSFFLLPSFLLKGEWRNKEVASHANVFQPQKKEATSCPGDCIQKFQVVTSSNVTHVLAELRAPKRKIRVKSRGRM